MLKTESISGFAASVVFHGLLLAALAMIQLRLWSKQPEVVLQTAFQEQPLQDDFSQLLDISPHVAETEEMDAGGVVSTPMTSFRAPAVTERKLASADSLAPPDIRVHTDPMVLPADGLLGEDLGAEEVSGETGAVVDDYGAALNRIAQELLRLMRKNRLLVVWAFDQSFSMKPDQQQIASQFSQVYRELEIQTQRDKKLRLQDRVLLTVISCYGIGVRAITQTPTSDLVEIRSAISKITVDESGEENMCRAVAEITDKYSVMAGRQKRKLVIIVVTDEAASDPERLEQALTRVRQTGTPVYVLGREAVFGYPVALMHWTDPKYGLDHQVKIHRGPETAEPECLQTDGLKERDRSCPSGFGPYAQVRLAKHSGSIFFLLRGSDESLVGFEGRTPPEFDPLVMKEYEPLLLARRDYADARKRSKFRSRIWDVIITLNPKLDERLKIRTGGFSIGLEDFRDEVRPEFEKALHALNLYNRASELLEEIRPLRAQEHSRRWQANFDLISAQCVAYRVRLFQLLLALDRHCYTPAKPANPRSNRWNVAPSKQLIQPDDRQFERLRRMYHIEEIRQEYLERLERERQRADAAYRFVEHEHPGTPWAYRAGRERNTGYGFQVKDSFHDPRYERFDRKEETLPNF